jgi:cyclohexanone monooxygenase
MAPTDSLAVLDVLIIGAGLSGIGAARHLQRQCPDKTWRIWEARQQMGGTWDLFRYPGVRSDSDMLTLGYAFKPWTGTQTMADGASILNYIRDAAHETGVDEQIAYGHKVVTAEWSSANACWTVTAVLANGDTVQQRARFVHLCGGYYSYERGHQPVFDRQAEFQGDLVYPQFWPAGLSHANKRVLVIGSGATAVTLVPAMAETATHVTMLQRSPSYVVSLPSQDPLPMLLGRWLPQAWAHTIARWKNILQGLFYFQLARRQPAFLKKYLVGMVQKALGSGFDVRQHFTPRYNPWTQRVCALPDGDLFKTLKAGRANVVTDEVAHFTPDGVVLQSGQQLQADIVVVATGLQLNVLGDVAFTVDGVAFEPGQAFSYKGCMLSGLPNVAVTFGYSNASWTLKADLIAGFVGRLLQHMDQHAYRAVCPTPAANMQAQPFMDFSSGYVVRSQAMLPKQGDRRPWRAHQNYLQDMWALRFASLNDGALRFCRTL